MWRRIHLVNFFEWKKGCCSKNFIAFKQNGKCTETWFVKTSISQQLGMETRA